MKGLEDFQVIFGEAAAEWEGATDSKATSLLSPILFHIHPLDASRIRIHASDFRSYTWESVRTIQNLEDLKDIVGIGGSWTEFIEYLMVSFSSDNVKLSVGGMHDSNGAASAKLVAQKSKGMPLISFSLSRIMNSSADDAKANIAFELFKAYKSKHNDIIREQGHSYQLTKMLNAEQEKNESIQNQLDAVAFSGRRKHHKVREVDKAFPISDPPSNLESLPAPNKQSFDMPSSKGADSLKVSNRVVPAYRRSKVRGAVLQDDTGDD